MDATTLAAAAAATARWDLAWTPWALPTDAVLSAYNVMVKVHLHRGGDMDATAAAARRVMRLLAEKLEALDRRARRVLAAAAVAAAAKAGGGGDQRDDGGEGG